MTTGAAAARWRRWRVPITIVALILAGGTVTALLQPAGQAPGYLDPAGDGPAGAHALTDLLAARGDQVIRAVAPAAAVRAAAGGATLVVTSPQFLSRSQLAAMAKLTGDVVVVAPDRAALSALAPAVSIGGNSALAPAEPRCGLAAARLAGNVLLGGMGLTMRQFTPSAQLCYRRQDLASLVRYTTGRKVITVLGSGLFLTNQDLARFGDAALALNLIGTGARIVWLAPPPAAVSAAGPGAGTPSLTSLIPPGVWLVAAQLCFAVLLAALWRARRLGPLVTERLPVVVRAAETVEGHGRLYRARRARGRAALALRTAVVGRLSPLAGLPREAAPDTVVAAVSARSGGEAGRIATILYGPAPGTDAALVTLADDLDDLERKVRAQ